MLQSCGQHLWVEGMWFGYAAGGGTWSYFGPAVTDPWDSQSSFTATLWCFAQAPRLLLAEVGRGGTTVPFRVVAYCWPGMLVWALPALTSIPFFADLYLSMIVQPAWLSPGPCKVFMSKRCCRCPVADTCWCPLPLAFTPFHLEGR